MVKIYIHFFPGDETFSYNFDYNKSFGELKNELNEQFILKKGTYYFEMNDHIMDDDLIFEDDETDNEYHINAIRNDCIKIKVEFKGENGEIKIVKCFMPISDLKIIKANENKEVNVCHKDLLLSFI